MFCGQITQPHSDIQKSMQPQCICNVSANPSQCFPNNSKEPPPPTGYQLLCLNHVVCIFKLKFQSKYLEKREHVHVVHKTWQKIFSVSDMSEQ